MPKIEDSDRIFWILLQRMLKDWREAVFFVKPDTHVNVTSHPTAAWTAR